MKITDLRFRQREYTPFHRLPGFSKSRGHYVPERASSSAVDWARSLLDEEAQAELQKVYQNSKDALGLRHRQVRKTVEKGGGTVETDFFRFTYQVSQSEIDPAEVRIQREITLLKPGEELPRHLDIVFPYPPGEIAIPLEAPDFDGLVESFEDLKEKRGGTLRDDASKGTIEYMREPLRLNWDSRAGELSIQAGNVSGCLPLLILAEEHLPFIEGALPGTGDLG